MFSKDIVDSDAFLDMPLSAQALYFHLGMAADDDGFVGNPKRLQRVIGCNDDDLKVLLGKRFIISFPSGVVVIKHHRINNNWDKHNCKRTVYLDEFNELNLKENRAYTMDKTKGIPVQTEIRLKPDCSQSLEENRIEENRIEETKECYGENKNVKLTPVEYNKLKQKYGKGATNRLIEELSDYISSSGKRYKSHVAVIRNWARRKGVEEVKSYVPPEETKLTPEELEKNKQRLAYMKQSLAGKLNINK